MKLAPGDRDVDYAKMGLFCAIATNMSSLTWKTFGYILYYHFGTDYLLFHLIYLFMHSLSETVVIALLVMIAFGWSLNYLSGSNLDIAMPGCNNEINHSWIYLDDEHYDNITNTANPQ